MYNGIGLQTARGSGTNGYIQSNKFFVRPKTGKVAFDGKGYEAGQGTAGMSKRPNKDILEHDRKRQIELKIVTLEEELLDQGYTDTEIAEKLAEKRKDLEAASAAEAEDGTGPTSNKISDTQTHQIAARKEKQLEIMREALGITTTEAADNQKEDGEVSDTDILNDIELRDDENKRLTDKKDDARKTVKSRKGEGGTDGLRSRKNRESKNRRQADSSDTDSGDKHAKESKKKHRKTSRSDSESDVDADLRKTSQKSKKEVKRHYSDDSDSDTNDEKYGKTRKRHSKKSSDDEKDKRIHKRHDKKGGKHDDDFRGERHGKTSKRRGSDSEASDSDSVDGERDKSRKGSGKKSKRYDSGSSLSDDEKDKRTQKRHDKKGRRHDSDDDSIGGKPGKAYKRHDSDSEASDSGMKVDKYDKSRGRLDKKSKRYDSESSQSDDEKYDKAYKIHSKNGTRRDSDDSHSEGERDKRTYKRRDSDGQVKKINQVEGRSQVNQFASNQRVDKEVAIRYHRKTEKHEKSSRKYHEESDLDRDRLKKDTVVGKSRRRSDSDDDSNLHDEKMKKTQLSGKHVIVKDDRGNKSDGSHGSDFDSDPNDHKRENRDSTKFSEMGRGRHRGDATPLGRQTDHGSNLEGRVSGGNGKRKEKNVLQKVEDRSDTFVKPEGSYRSRGDTIGHSGHDNKGILSSKRKGEETNQDDQPVAKSRSRHVGQETDHGKSKEQGKDTRSASIQDDQQSDDYSKVNRAKGRESDAIEHGSGTRSKEDVHSESRRSNRDQEEQRGSRRYSRDDENRENKHKRVEEDMPKKDGKDEEHHVSRRRGRNEDEERGTRRNERAGIKDQDDDEKREKKLGKVGEDVRGGDGKAEEHHGSRRYGRKEEECGSRGDGKTGIKDQDDDENREKKRGRDEDHHGKRRHGRDEEEERGNGRNERGDRHPVASKRGKLEDSRSSEGRRYDDIDREDGGRSRRRD